MSDTWYAQRGEKQVGPMPLATLREALAAGRLQGQDHVWNEGWDQWRRAADVAELTAGLSAAPAAAAVVEPEPAEAMLAGEPIGSAAFSAAPSGPLGYRGAVSGPIEANDGAIAALSKTRPWVMLMAVVLFLVAGLSVLAVVGLLIAGGIGVSNGEDEAAFFLGISAVYVIAGLIYFFLGLYLVRFFSAIGATARLRRPEDLERAMVAQMKFWRLVGIITIVFVAAYPVVIGIAIFFA